MLHAGPRRRPQGPGPRRPDRRTALRSLGPPGGRAPRAMVGPPCGRAAAARPRSRAPAKPSRRPRGVPSPVAAAAGKPALGPAAPKSWLHEMSTRAVSGSSWCAAPSAWPAHAPARPRAPPPLPGARRSSAASCRAAVVGVQERGSACLPGAALPALRRGRKRPPTCRRPRGGPSLLPRQPWAQRQAGAWRSGGSTSRRLPQPCRGMPRRADSGCTPPGSTWGGASAGPLALPRPRPRAARRRPPPVGAA
mmetsp:Transcript_119180/g.384811  ORF Transcript_119180/g.384811 Transcript_119180/m.384811 type:complete len:250 (+) Transcript_119180:895-1644(+)